MIYAAMIFWLLVIVFTAYGVYQMWTAMTRPKVINVLLLPGTLIAQLGHVVGQLITGGTVDNTSLIKDDSTGEPSQGAESKSRIPVIGPMIVALLPLAACATAIYWVIQWLGTPPPETILPPHVSPKLPTNLTMFWEFLRDTLTSVEHWLIALLSRDFHDWHTWVFCYLILCLTVRMAPMPGLRRGAIGAIVLVGLLMGLVGTFASFPQKLIVGSWDLLTFTVSALLFLLIATLIVRSGVGLLRVLTGRTGSQASARS